LKRIPNFGTLSSGKCAEGVLLIFFQMETPEFLTLYVDIRAAQGCKDWTPICLGGFEINRPSQVGCAFWAER